MTNWSPPRNGGRTVGALVALLAAVGMLLTATVAHADTATQADRLGLTVTAGIDGHRVAGTWTPIEVRLKPAEPFAGQIVLASGGEGGQRFSSLDVEVAAGTEKRFLLLAPPAQDWRVQAVADGQDEGVTVRPGGDTVDGYLVGHLGGFGSDQPPAVTLPMTDQRATFAAVDPEVLELGPRALAGLSTLAVTQPDLLALSDVDRGTVEAAVAHGLQLLVTEVTDPDLGLPWSPLIAIDQGSMDPAPGAWGRQVEQTMISDGEEQPRTATTVTAVAAGRGRVTAMLGALAAAGDEDLARLWEDVLQPSEAAVSSTDSSRWSNLTGTVEQAFSATTGTPFPLRWLGGFFVLYLVVVGPLVGVLMSRRRRPELAWVVVPVVTAVFATAAFVGASGARPRVGVAARVDTWTDGIGETVAVAGVRSPRPGTHAVTLPGTGWDVIGTGWETSAHVHVDDDTRIDLSLQAQSFGGAVAWRPQPDTSPLDLEIALVGGQAHVEATNVSGQALTGLRLRVAEEVVDLADLLAPGDTLVEQVDLPDGLPRQRDPFGEMFFDDFGRMDQDNPDALTSLIRWQPVDGSPGMVWVLASTSTGADGIDVDGTAPTDRGGLVAVGVTPTSTDDDTSPFEVQRDLVAVPRGNTWRDAPQTVSGSGPATLRFRLPREAPLAALRLELEAPAFNGGGFIEPMPMPIDQCGELETRDADGDLVSSEEFCGPGPPCPPDAVSCSFNSGPNGVTEGEVCFEDGSCVEQRWEADGLVREVPAELAGGVQVWDRLDRTWVDQPADGALDEIERWVSPLGEVWVRATGELPPWDLSPQGVGADLDERGTA